MEYAIKLESWKNSCRKFVMVGKPIWTSGMSMLLPKGSPLTETMSVATMEILQNKSKSPIQEWFDVNGECSLDVGPTLTMKKLRFFFILSFSTGGLIFAFMLFDRMRVSKSATGEKKPASRDPNRDLTSQKQGHCDDRSSFSEDDSFDKIATNSFGNV